MRASRGLSMGSGALGSRYWDVQGMDVCVVKVAACRLRSADTPASSRARQAARAAVRILQAHCKVRWPLTELGVGENPQILS